MGTRDNSPRHRRRPTAAIVDKESFASNLDALLTTSRLTLRELAGRAGTSASTISSWRKGRHLPYPRQDDVVAAMLAELGVDDPQRWLDGLNAARADAGRPVGENPYRGLEPFTEDNVDVFFGREDLIETLWGRVRNQLKTGPEGPVILVGSSGSGKTSALRAGLNSVLKANDLSGRYLAAESSPQLDASLDLNGIIGSESSEILIVDQFETVLGDTRALSAKAVNRLARHEKEGNIVVIGLRADHYHLGLEHDYLARSLRHPVVPDTMTDDRIADMIELPAQTANMSVEPNLTRQLLADFGEQVRSGRVGEVLPLLSHVLYKIVDNPTGTAARELTLQRYREVGGLEGALRTSAEQVYRCLDQSGQNICRQIFVNLVEVGRDGLPLRRRAQLASLEAAAESVSQGPMSEKVVDEWNSEQ